MSARFHVPARARRQRNDLMVASFVLALTMLGIDSTPAWALVIEFNGGATTISDNGVGDLNPTAGILDFNTTVGLYQVQGTVDLSAGPNVISLIGTPTASVRLTNFTAEALGSSLPALGIKFYDAVAGTFPSLVGADSIDAYAAHATGAPIPPGNDLLLDWQGYIDGWPIFPYSPGSPPYPSPFVPPFSPPVPYTVVTQGSSTFTGPFTNPVISAYLTIQLGSLGDQFILQSSAEIGFVPVPETSTLVMTGLGGFAILMTRKKSFVRRMLTNG